MKMTKVSLSLLAMTLGSVMAAGTAYADTSTIDKAQTMADSAGQKIDSSVTQVGHYMDDSAITAKVKSALMDNDAVKSTDISVKTEKGVVTLKGFVPSQGLALQAVKTARGVEGVKSVSDELHVKTQQSDSVKGYAGDSATTSEIKAKFLTDDIIPSRHISVETTQGIVLLTGTVDTPTQAARAEQVAKAVKGVKSVKNELKVKA